MSSSSTGVVFGELAGDTAGKATVLETFGLAEGSAVDEGGVVQDLMPRLNTWERQ